MCYSVYAILSDWGPELNLYQPSLEAVFAAIQVLYSIPDCLLESLLWSLLGRLHETLLERSLHWKE
jgi:hypothetical protein